MIMEYHHLWGDSNIYKSSINARLFIHETALEICIPGTILLSQDITSRKFP
jgi:hypothetical protein